MWYFFFCAWLTSFNIISTRFNHIVMNDRIFFFFCDQIVHTHTPHTIFPGPVYTYLCLWLCLCLCLCIYLLSIFHFSIIYLFIYLSSSITLYFTHSFIDRQILVRVNNAAMNRGMLVCLQRTAFISFEHLLSCGSAVSYGTSVFNI
jgi:hypothetical protein